MTEINKMQGERETKVYLKMAYFYENVVFKQNECAMMFDKARLAL